jgi:hypothetical protein
MSTTSVAVAAQDRGGAMVAVPAPTRGALIVADALKQESEQRHLLGQYVAHHMVEGTDYGAIPGTKNKTLLKPGAEKLTQLFRTIPRYTVEDKVENWETGLFSYRFRCQIVTQDDDTVVAEGVGSCSTFESRYRWRNADRTCPECGAPAIKRSKYPPKNNPGATPGWYCFGKAGGCGANFDYDDADFALQPTGRVQNPDLIDCVNTVLKMAKKRALVDAAIALARCSDIFIQDAEEFADAHPAPVAEAEKPRPAPQQSDAELVALCEDARHRIRAAKTPDELLAVWKSLPDAVKARVVADKDKRKAELAATAPTPKAAPAGDADLELDDLRAACEEAILEAGSSEAAALGRFHRALQCDARARLTDLSAEQLENLTALVRGEAAKTAGAK